MPLSKQKPQLCYCPDGLMVKLRVLQMRVLVRIQLVSRQLFFIFVSNAVLRYIPSMLLTKFQKQAFCCPCCSSCITSYYRWRYTHSKGEAMNSSSCHIVYTAADIVYALEYSRWLHVCMSLYKAIHVVAS